MHHNSSVDDKETALLVFHQMAHQQFILRSDDQWKGVYRKALKEFNEKAVKTQQDPIESLFDKVVVSASERQKFID